MAVTCIQSLHNPRLVRWREAMSGQSEMFWAQGIHLLTSALQANTKITEIIYDETARDDTEVQQIIKQLSMQTQHYVLAPQVAQKLFQLNQGHGLRIAASGECLNLKYTDTGRSVLFLDRLQDAGNVGTILRTASAAGMAAVYLRKGCARAWSAKVLRAAMGAHWHLPIFENIEIEQLQQTLALEWYVADHQANQSLYTLDLRKPVCWVFGHEGQGVSPELINAATLRLRIPHAQTIESLNVASSAAICLFEQCRQMRLHH